MALVLKDRVKETTVTTGTGTYTLDGAVTGFESFGEVGDANTTYYACSNGTDFEIGIGTYTASGTTLARTTILQSSNADAAVNWTAGTKTIFCTLPAEKMVFEDASGNVAVAGTVDGRDIATDGTKLDGIEASADVTDATNVAAAGALMDSEVTNLAQVKAFNSADYATAAQGTTADAALPKTGGAMTGNIDFGQSNKALFGGVGGDLEIYHNGTDGYIDNNDGHLYIRNNVDGDDGGNIVIQAKSGENSIYINDDGTVNLYYDSALKLNTSSTGVSINGVAAIFGHVEAKGFEEAVYSLGTTGGTITPNFINGAIQKITLNANLTFSAFTSPVAGQSITLIIDTNGTGRTLTSTMKFAGGNKTMSTTDTIDVMTVLYDGTNYLANYVKDFS